MKCSALSLAILGSSLFVAVPANAQDELATEAGQPPVTVTQVTIKPEKEKITDRSHPDYIRCRYKSVIGSRAKRRKVCLTNREWKQASARGNRGSRQIVDDASQGGMRTDTPMIGGTGK